MAYARFLAAFSAGRSIPARMAMIAITTVYTQFIVIEILSSKNRKTGKERGVLG